jgi:hypothetical protein
MTTPRRRRSFSLRMLFVVVTVLACCIGWVGWQIRAIQERQLEAQHLQDLGSAVLNWKWYKGVRQEYYHRIPWWRSWLGDDSYVLICEPEAGFNQAYAEKLGRIFPEAEIAWRMPSAEPADDSPTTQVDRP